MKQTHLLLFIVIGIAGVYSQSLRDKGKQTEKSTLKVSVKPHLPPSQTNVSKSEQLKNGHASPTIISITNTTKTSPSVTLKSHSLLKEPNGNDASNASKPRNKRFRGKRTTGAKKINTYTVYKIKRVPVRGRVIRKQVTVVTTSSGGGGFTSGTKYIRGGGKSSVVTTKVSGGKFMSGGGRAIIRSTSSAGGGKMITNRSTGDVIIKKKVTTIITRRGGRRMGLLKWIRRGRNKFGQASTVTTKTTGTAGGRMKMRIGKGNGGGKFRSISSGLIRIGTKAIRGTGGVIIKKIVTVVTRSAGRRMKMKNRKGRRGGKFSAMTSGLIRKGRKAIRGTGGVILKKIVTVVTRSAGGGLVGGFLAGRKIIRGLRNTFGKGSTVITKITRSAGGRMKMKNRKGRRGGKLSAMTSGLIRKGTKAIRGAGGAILKKIVTVVTRRAGRGLIGGFLTGRKIIRGLRNKFGKSSTVTTRTFGQSGGKIRMASKAGWSAKAGINKGAAEIAKSGKITTTTTNIIKNGARGKLHGGGTLNANITSVTTATASGGAGRISTGKGKIKVTLPKGKLSKGNSISVARTSSKGLQVPAGSVKIVTTTSTIDRNGKSGRKMGIINDFGGKRNFRTIYTKIVRKGRRGIRIRGSGGKRIFRTMYIKGTGGGQRGIGVRTGKFRTIYTRRVRKRRRRIRMRGSGGKRIFRTMYIRRTRGGQRGIGVQSGGAIISKKTTVTTSINPGRASRIFASRYGANWRTANGSGRRGKFRALYTKFAQKGRSGLSLPYSGGLITRKVTTITTFNKSGRRDIAMGNAGLGLRLVGGMGGGRKVRTRLLHNSQRRIRVPVGTVIKKVTTISTRIPNGGGRRYSFRMRNIGKMRRRSLIKWTPVGGKYGIFRGSAAVRTSTGSKLYNLGFNDKLSGSKSIGAGGNLGIAGGVGKLQGNVGLKGGGLRISGGLGALHGQVGLKGGSGVSGGLGIAQGNFGIQGGNRGSIKGNVGIKGGPQIGGTLTKKGLSVGTNLF